MAETATPTATPAPTGAPSEPGSGQAPASPPATPPKPPTSADQARRQAREAVATRARETQATPPKETAPPAEGEQPPATPSEPPATPPEPPASTPATPPADGGEAPAEKPPEGIKVEVSADHPLANGKAGAITVANEDEARMVRGLLNSTGVRVRELTGLRTRAQEAERRAMDVEQKLARLETTIDVKQEWEATPEHAQVVERYRAILEEHGKPDADAYLRGKTAEMEQRAQAKFQAREQELRAESDQRALHDWAREAYIRLETLPAIVREQQQFSTWFQTALRSFQAQAAAGGVTDDVGQPIRPGDTEALHKAFRSHFEAYVISRPDVRKAYAEAKTRQQQQEKAAADKATAEQQRIDALVTQRVAEELKKQRGVVPPHPLGQIPSAARAVDPNAAGAEVPASASLASADQVRRAARTQVVDRARSRYGGGT